MYVKYPKTPHLPFSNSVTRDDKVVSSLANLVDREVIITEKMDGENTTLYHDHLHARSLDSKQHPSRSWIKNFHAKINTKIPVGWRICGENLYAKHSILYTNLKSYFYGFSIWDDRNVALDWDATLMMFNMLNITSVPVIYRGIFDLEYIKQLITKLDLIQTEGIVVRLAAEFNFIDFDLSVVKWVRPDHVTIDKHWSTDKIERNKLSTVL